LVYGDGSRTATLYEDDGSHAPSLNAVHLSWDAGNKKGAVSRDGGPAAEAYKVVAWEQK
jgi:hypothetical protein